jgi:hypothetical protein
MPHIRQDSLVSSDLVNDEGESIISSQPDRETPQTPPEETSDPGPTRAAKRGRKPKSVRQTKDTSTQLPVRRSSRVAKPRAAKTRAASQTQAIQATRATKTRQVRGRPKKTASTSKVAVKAGGREWEVEKVVASRIDADTYEPFYQVKWKGYPAKENTWEPKSNLSNCPQALRDFEKLAESNK